MSDEKKRIIIEVGGKQLDVSEVPSLTVGDRIDLKADGVEFAKMAKGEPLDPTEEAKLALCALKKLSGDITMDHVRLLPALTCSNLVRHFLQRSAEIDDPFSTRSTSSEKPTAGASEKSVLSPLAP